MPHSFVRNLSNDKNVLAMNKFLKLSVWFVPLLTVAMVLLLLERDLLWKVQQLNLFLFTPEFFKEQMVVPGGLLTYLGTFFTQFFFQTWLGVLILCAWWWMLMWLTKRTFCLADHWNALPLVPVALLIVANMDAGYWLYVLKLRGYFFVATIGTTLAVSLLWAYRLLGGKKPWWRLALLVLTAAVGYPLMGIYALAAVLLMGVWTWRLEQKRWAAATTTALALLMVAAVPLIYYRYVFYQTNLSNIYSAALPIYIFNEEYHIYYLPFYLLASFYAMLAMANWQREDKKGKMNKRSLLVQWTTVVITALAVGVFWYKDENFHHELRMQHCIERLDWDGVLREAIRQKDEPTRAVVLMRNLALGRIGRQGDDMYTFPGGSKKSKAPFTVLMGQVAGHLLYYNYGLLNECHRVCMEEGVETGWRAEHLQYFARCALLNGERQAARKYLDLLSKTLYFGRWARWLYPMVNDPKQMEKAPEMAAIKHMMHYENCLGSDNGFIEKYLMQLLAEQESDDPVFQEQALLATLWTRDPKLFWPRFVKYAGQHPHDRIPRHFQEAAYLFCNLENRQDIQQAPFNKDVKRTYHAFMQELKKCDGMPIEQVRAKLYPAFGTTYYFEYFLMKGITLA